MSRPGSPCQASIRFQLALFTHRLVANKMQLAASEDNQNTAMLCALKMVMMSVFHYKDAPRHAAEQTADGQGEGGCAGGGGENRIMTKLAQIQEDPRRQHELSEQRYERIEGILSIMQVLHKTVL